MLWRVPYILVCYILLLWFRSLAVASNFSEFRTNFGTFWHYFEQNTTLVHIRNLYIWQVSVLSLWICLGAAIDLHSFTVPVYFLFLCWHPRTHTHAYTLTHQDTHQFAAWPLEHLGSVQVRLHFATTWMSSGLVLHCRKHTHTTWKGVSRAVRQGSLSHSKMQHQIGLIVYYFCVQWLCVMHIFFLVSCSERRGKVKELKNCQASWDMCALMCVRVWSGWHLV